MDQNRNSDRKTSLPMAALVALGGGLAVGLASLLVPATAFENLITAYGISELLPAAAPPLGMTAKLLIAVSSGLFTASCLYLILHYKGSSNMASAFPQPSLPKKDRIMNVLRTLRFGKQEAKQGEIADFDDLPKLRISDSHPDAPARRPIRAAEDLGAPLTLGLNDALDDDDDTAGETVVEETEHRSVPAFLQPAELDDDAPFHDADMPRDLPRFKASDAEPTDSFNTKENYDDDIGVATGSLAEEPAFEDEPDTLAAFAHGPAIASDEAERPLRDLSIAELMERLERGIANRKAAPAAKTEHSVTPLRHYESTQARDEVDGQASEKHLQSSDDRPQQTDEATEPQPEFGAKLEIAEPVTEAAEDDLDEALKAALETLRVMTDRQRNAT